MAIIDLDSEFNITQLRNAGLLVLSFAQRVAPLLRKASPEKRALILQESATIRGLLKLRDKLSEL